MVLLGKARMSMRGASPRNLEPSGLESGIFFSDPRDARERDFSFSLSLTLRYLHYSGGPVPVD